MAQSKVFRSGQMVHQVNADGEKVNGIVSDAWVKEAGRSKGEMDVVFVGARYGVQPFPEAELKEGWAL